MFARRICAKCFCVCLRCKPHLFWHQNFIKRHQKASSSKHKAYFFVTAALETKPKAKIIIIIIMSVKFLQDVSLLPAKLFINMYTALSLPFYALYQAPWRRLKASRAIRTRSYIDPANGHRVWMRDGPPMRSFHMKYATYVEALQHLDRSRQSIGVRDVINEVAALDEHGK